MEPPTEVQNYDEYLGNFVDAIQLEDLGYEQLFEEWLNGCPPEWRLRFSEDAVEIESLIQSGAFLLAVDA